MENIFFGLKFHLDKVAFTIPYLNWKVYWYGFLIVAGILAAVFYAVKRCPEYGINPDKLVNCTLVTVPVAIIGARLYYMLFSGSFNSISDFINIHNGGLAIYGGIIFAVLAGYICVRVAKLDVLSCFDLTALGFLIGQAIGRWGNFVNQEAYGSFTGSSWFGIGGTNIAEEMKSKVLVHPCFLYESLWCILGFIILSRISKKRRFKGQIAILYIIWYGFGRFFIEGLREDSLIMNPFGIRVSQFLSILLVIAGVFAFIIMNKLYGDPAGVPDANADASEDITNEQS